ncbi:MAG: AsmA family protein [Bacteroidetes bacterium]|nr:AsmA family protein [Bacteroidota bacterium]
MKRILLILLALFLLLVSTIVVLPYFFKDDIVAYIKNETLYATINFDEDINLGLISTFPNLYVGIKSLSIVNKAPFEGDTLFFAEEIKVEVDIMRIISGHMEVKSVDLVSPRILVQVMKDGRASYDITLPSDSTEQEAESEESAPYSFKLSSLSITNAHMQYLDSSLATFAQLRGFNFLMSGDFNEVEMAIETQMNAKGLSLDYEGVPYLTQAAMSYTAGLVLYLNEEKYVFKENELLINDLGLSFDGSMQFVAEDMDFDLSFGITKTDFRTLLSLVPSLYANDFAGLQASGNVGLDGFLKGTMTETLYPAFGLNLLVENGAFKYPDLPTELRNTQVELAVTNPGGIFDLTVVDLLKCHVELDKEPFDLRLLMKNPDSDPFVDMALEGSIMLERIAGLLPLDGVSTFKGMLTTNFSASGKMSDVEGERYDAFNASGGLTLKDFAYQDADLPELVQIPVMDFVFTPEKASLQTLDILLGSSDISMTGYLQNYLPYLFHGQTVKGQLDVKGNYLDLNPWLADEEAPGTDAGETEGGDDELSVVEVPANIDFALNTLIKKVKYDTYDMDNMRGLLMVQNQTITFKDLGVDMLGGSMTIAGSYSTQAPNKPSTDLTFDMNSLSIPGVYETFMTVRELMPIAQQIKGNISGRIALRNNLGTDMMPVLESVNGKAKLDIARMELEGNSLWEQAVQYLGWDESMKRLVITKIKPSFVIKDGNIFLDPFDFDIKGQSFTFGGKSSLNQTIDYALDTEVPAKGLGDKAETLVSELTKGMVNPKLPEKLPLRFMITGPMDKPTMKPVLRGAEGADLKTQVKETAKELIEEGKEQAIAKGKDALKKEAELLRAQSKELRAKAAKLKTEAAGLSKKGEELKAESAKLRAEAQAQKAKIEKEMASLPKLARDKAMIPVNALFSKADEKMAEANKTFDLAKKPEQEADKLLMKADELDKKAEALLKD